MYYISEIEKVKKENESLETYIESFQRLTNNQNKSFDLKLLKLDPKQFKEVQDQIIIEKENYKR